jgi:hypothetical protein
MAVRLAQFLQHPQHPERPRLHPADHRIHARPLSPAQHRKPDQRARSITAIAGAFAVDRSARSVSSSSMSASPASQAPGLRLPQHPVAARPEHRRSHPRDPRPRPAGIGRRRVQQRKCRIAWMQSAPAPRPAPQPRITGADLDPRAPRPRRAAGRRPRPRPPIGAQAAISRASAAPRRPACKARSSPPSGGNRPGRARASAISAPSRRGDIAQARGLQHRLDLVAAPAGRRRPRCAKARVPLEQLAQRRCGERPAGDHQHRVARPPVGQRRGERLIGDARRRLLDEDRRAGRRKKPCALTASPSAAGSRADRRPTSAPAASRPRPRARSGGNRLCRRSATRIGSAP